MVLLVRFLYWKSEFISLISFFATENMRRKLSWLTHLMSWRRLTLHFNLTVSHFFSFLLYLFHVKFCTMEDEWYKGRVNKLDVKMILTYWYCHICKKLWYKIYQYYRSTDININVSIFYSCRNSEEYTFLKFWDIRFSYF